MHTIPAHVLDSALANISDVPVVEIESGVVKVTFTGNYEPPVNDLVDFLGALQRTDPVAAEYAREGLYWEDGFYGGYAVATLNGLALEGTSRSAYQPCEQCGGKVDDADMRLCEDCRLDAEEGALEPMDMSGGSGGSTDR